MGTKNNPGSYDCYANAEPDEPMFILLGRDKWAAFLVEEWARLREIAIKRGDKPETDRPMIDEARACAETMRVYRTRRNAVPQS